MEINSAQDAIFLLNIMYNEMSANVIKKKRKKKNDIPKEVAVGISSQLQTFVVEAISFGEQNASKADSYSGLYAMYAPSQMYEAKGRF